MRAARLHAYGPPENLVVEDVPEPKVATATDVRVRVHASSINPIDWKIRAGYQRGIVRIRLPATLGLDVSGEVLEVGAAVTRFKAGDLVYGCPSWRRDGAYAEQCVLDEGLLAHKPVSLSHLEAASLPLVGLTAWQCLLPRLAEKPGQRVLIQAGSGGVGTFAIQLAKHHGAWVAATCSAANAELVRALGADQAVDYKHEKWWEILPDLDVILDAIGGDERSRALRAVKKGGRIASISSGLPENSARYGPNLGALATGLGIAWFWLRGRLRGVDAMTLIKVTRADQLAAIAKLADTRVIKPVIDQAFPLDAIAEAHRYGETGRIRGKVVISVTD
jgi:NADPH:quinone reductase-like Zn-dependent oxidoreductase